MSPRIVFAALALLPGLCQSQSLPAELRQALQTEAHFSADDLAKIESGQAVAHMLPTGRPDDQRLVGVILIKTSAEEYVKAFRDIERFSVSKEVIRTHRFSSPAVESDLAGLEIPDVKKDVLACRPGHCAYKLPAEAMKNFQQGIDWNAPDAEQKVQTFIHQRIVEYINAYRAKGDAALAVYSDASEPYPVADGLHSLIGSETKLGQTVPDLVRYASNYPADAPPGASDFFYWQEAAFGLKHVIRLEHVLMQKLPPLPDGDSPYAIISKMLFATHYFRAAIEVQYIRPVRAANGGPAIYLLSAQRSYVDGMTGAKGAIIRKVAEGRSPASLVTNLEQAKSRLER